MAADDPSARDIFDPSSALDPPATRPLKVYAYDPSQGRRLGNCMQAQIRYEKLAPGPVGSRFAVVDYDGASKAYYLPVDLDDPLVLIRGGLDPSEVDPRFHQQMVYAVANETLERFEAALGRRVHWRRPIDDGGKPIYGRPNRLYLHPHAMRQANAFYSPDAHAILFGYFQASADDPGQNLPGQTVFTCLSHDIVAHETTHAVVDGVRPYLMEPTNIDVPAFHEAFADLAALFRHFSHRETLLDTLQRTGGRLYDLHLKSNGQMFRRPSDDDEGAAPPKTHAQIQADIAQANPLIALANQFGEATGKEGGLRSALGTPPEPEAIKTTIEAHARGAILVSAVFDAYFTIYMARTAPLFRINRAAQGTREDLPQPLAELLAAEAGKTADMFFGICARALDYCPPVDLTFGDFLRALITADIDLYPDDTDGVRDALMQAFRLRGIAADDAQYFSEGSLCWPRLAPDALVLPYLKFGDPNGLTRPEQDENGEVLRKWASENAEKLGFDPKVEIEVPSFHPMFRISQSGELKIDMVVELIQTTYDPPEGKLTGAMPLRGGMTLIIAKPSTLDGDRAPPHVRYAIPKHLTPARISRQQAAFGAQGVTMSRTGRFAIDFALLHEGG